MASIFTKIVAGEIPSFKVAETANCFAFLDINPLKMGHVLVIPKREVDYIFDLSTEEYADLMLFVKQVANSVKACVPCIKVGVAVIGLEVPHAHVHLVPLEQIGDLNFSKTKLNPSKEDLQEMANKLAAKFLELS
jgi:histidine triad (HIT) family protein